MKSSRAAIALVFFEVLLLSLAVKFFGISPKAAFGIIFVQSLIYGSLNGGNDAPNSTATLVATAAMTMLGALAIATLFNFLGTIAGEAVAKTIAKGIVPLEHFTANIAMAGAGGAIICASLATLHGLPISITHSLVGGILGAGIGAGLLYSGDPLAKIAWDPILPPILIATAIALGVGAMAGWLYGKPKKLNTSYYILLGCIMCVGLTSSSIFAYTIYADISVKLARIALGVTLAPFWSIILGFVLTKIVNASTILMSRLIQRVFHKRATHHGVNEFFRKLQWMSGAGLSFSHGWNDGQNIIAIMIFASVIGGYSQGTDIPFWMKLAAASSIAFGTFAFGIPVLRTMAFKVTRMTPAAGFAAQMSAATINAIHTAKQIAFIGGVPISTTHAKGGAIMGTALAHKIRFLSIETSVKMLSAWIFTLPFAALLGMLLMFWLEVLT